MRKDEGEMSRRSERGEGRFGTFVGLVLLASVLWMAWHVAPVFIKHYALKDKVSEIARTSKWRATDDALYDQLMNYVRDEDLDRYVNRGCFEIRTAETTRRIRLTYEREVEVLPGFKRVFKFDDEMESPLS